MQEINFNNDLIIRKVLSILIILFSISSSFSQANIANCDDAIAFCGSASHSFPNSTSTTAPSGPNYGCMQQQPSPMWYYMEVGQSGNIAMTISQSNGSIAMDVDFAMWGPFSNPSDGCNQINNGTPPIQSSWSSSSVEYAGIGVSGGSNSICAAGMTAYGQTTPPPAQAGDYYIVLVSNYDNSAGTVTFDQTNAGQPGAGNTNCAIVEPCIVDNITATATCNGNTTIITGTVSAGTGMTTGSLVVSSSCGTDTQSFVIDATNFPAGSALLNYTITAGAGTGQPCTVTAEFTDNQLCNNSIDITLPDCSSTPCPTISPTSAVLCQGDDITITATTTTGTWSTSDAAIATVNGGQVTAISNGTATITYTQDTCVIQSIITVSDPITPSFTNPGPICIGNSYTLPTTSSEGITGSWSPTIDNTQTTDYTFTPNTGECAVNTTMQVVAMANSTPTFDNPGPICSGQSFTLPNTSNEGITGSWSPAMNNTLTTTYTFTPTPGTCGDVITMEVEVVTDVTPIFNLPSIICENETFELPTTSKNGINGVWTPNKITSSDSVYTFIVTDPNSCAHNLTITIPFVPMSATTEVTASSTTVLEGNQTNLNAVITPYISGILFSWDPNETLNCSDCPNPLATPTEATWYVVTMTTPEGCSYKDSIFIDYRLNCGDIYIPNVFSPNDDGENDIFKPYGRCLAKGEMVIFNRWGQKVFTSEDLESGWDGTINGKLANTDVYHYIIKTTSIYEEREEFKGTVTLVR